MMGRLLPLMALLFAVAWATPQASAQDTQDAEEKSTLVKFVEKQLSAPNRQISLNGLRGSLSSNVELDSITIADEKGVWLKITEPKLVWTRSALLVGKLEIGSLTAKQVDYLRPANVDENLPAPEALSFELPDLPVTVVIEKLDIPKIIFGQSVFGLKAETAVAGKVRLADGALDLDLKIDRKDGPGGQFDVVAKYVSDTQQLTLDLALEEPQNGIVANLLELEGRPPVALKITGDAPISQLQVDLSLDVAKQRVLSGDLKLEEVAKGYRAMARMNGPLSSIMPRQYRDFFGTESRLDADALFETSGVVEIENLKLRSGAMSLDATARRLADGFISALKIDGSLAPQSGEKLLLPTGEAQTSVAGAKLKLDYDAANNSRWNGQLLLEQFGRDDVKIDSVTLDADGTVDGLSGPRRVVTFNLDGGLTGFEAAEAALNEAVGRNIQLKGSGQWASDEALMLERFRVSGETFDLVSNGRFADRAFDGAVELNARRLAAFSALAGRSLSGRAVLRTDGQIWPLSGAFDLRINGTTTDLKISEPSLDPLLTEETTLSGGVARDGQGLDFKDLRISNRSFQTSLNGRYATDKSDLTAVARLRDLALISDQGSGAVNLTARIQGTEKPFKAEVSLAMEKGSLSGRAISDLSLHFDGTTDTESINGTLSSSGTLDDKPVVFAGRVSASPDRISAKDMRFEAGEARLSGQFDRGQNGLIEADLDIAARNINSLAALALLKAEGAVNGKVQLSADNGKQSGTADIELRDFRYQQNRVSEADVDATFEDLFGTPVVDGSVKANGVSVNGVDITTLNADVRTQGDTSTFDGTATLRQNNARIAATGSLKQAGGTQTIRLERLAATSNITDLRLQSPTSLTLKNGAAQFSGANFAVGGGRIVVSGTAGQTLALRADLQSVPLAIINTIRPQTRAGGTVSGQVFVNGTASNPNADFNLTGRGVSAAPLQDAGIRPLTLSVNGTYSANRIRLQSSRFRNGQNISLTASGTIPLSGSGLALTADGTFPLAIAQSQIADRGASISGTGRISIFASGSLASPRANGFIEARGATLSDPLSNLRVTNISLRAGIRGNTITVSRAQGNLASGGSVSAAGTVGLGGGMPANLSVRLNRATYTDGQTFVTTADGNLRLTGNLASNPLLSGQIELLSTEITVPESFIKDRDLLDVRHVRPSTNVQSTLKRVKRASPIASPSSRPSILRLDLVINAPNRIFVRGRGLDAELGGQVRVRGSAVNVRPIGEFTLRRGRLSIVGQRLNLDEGSITLAGDLDPILDLRASVDVDDVEAFIRLQGRASQLEVVFASSPELPEDEVLALIVFGRGLDDLSPVQIVRLASIAAELTGGNSPGLVDGIRRGTGLDDLDVVTDSEGNAAVKAGKYISDKVYLGVQAGQNTKATINLDVTDNVKVRGSVDSEGAGDIGIFLEKDY